MLCLSCCQVMGQSQTYCQTHHQCLHGGERGNDILLLDQSVMAFHPLPKSTWELVFPRLAVIGIQIIPILFNCCSGYKFYSIVIYRCLLQPWAIGKNLGFESLHTYYHHPSQHISLFLKRSLLYAPVLFELFLECFYNCRSPSFTLSSSLCGIPACMHFKCQNVEVNSCSSVRETENDVFGVEDL